MDRVRLWWGIIGSISDATGRLERRPVADGVWLDTEFDVYFYAPVLFRTTRQSTTTQWSESSLRTDRAPNVGEGACAQGEAAGSCAPYVQRVSAP